MANSCILILSMICCFSAISSRDQNFMKNSFSGENLASVLPPSSRPRMNYRSRSEIHCAVLCSSPCLALIYNDTNKDCILHFNANDTTFVNRNGSFYAGEPSKVIELQLKQFQTKIHFIFMQNLEQDSDLLLLISFTCSYHVHYCSSYQQSFEI